jgi:hypothetical protein
MPSFDSYSMPSLPFSSGQSLSREEVIRVIEPLAIATYRVKKKQARHVTQEWKGNNRWARALAEFRSAVFYC